MLEPWLVCPPRALKSSTRVFKVRNYRISNPQFMFFRGHRWDFAVWCPYNDDDVIFHVKATPHFRPRTQTMDKAKISIEILDESGKPVPVVVFNNPQVQLEIKVRSYTRPPFFDNDPTVLKQYQVFEETTSIKRRELEMLPCVQNKSFTFRCTVSEDVPLGILSKLRSRVVGIFSKPNRQGYARLMECPSN